MAYQGNVPAEAYTNTVKDTFNGNGSTTAFTLSLPTVTNDIRVVVENVVQEPTAAYSVSGTTLTFTAAPPSGTGNVYVVHLGPAVQTAIPPSEIAGATVFASNVTVQGAFTSLGIDDNATSTAITIDSSENVGIGTASPATTLDVTKSAGGNWIASFQNTTAATSYGVNIAEPSGAAGGYPLFRVGESYAPYTDYLRVNTGGGVVAGGGIYIGGTAPANLLEDYEEGTFTPSYVGSISGTAVHTIQIGTYLKVGNLCTVWIRLSGSQNNISGSVLIAGLPFTAANRSTYGWMNATNGTWSWTTRPRTVYVNNNATTIGMWDDGTGTISSGSMNTGTSGNNIEFQVSYKTQ